MLLILLELLHGNLVLFSYFFRVYEYFESKGVLEELRKKKNVFREPKKTSEMDKVLQEYSRSAKRTGAVLFSVVGGKISLGLCQDLTILRKYCYLKNQYSYLKNQYCYQPGEMKCLIIFHFLVLVQTFHKN